MKRTPLHEAAIKGKTEVATFLISKGADPNAVDVVSYMKYATNSDFLLVLNPSLHLKLMNPYLFYEHP